jgi:cation diffusion facilitator family transporter
LTRSKPIYKIKSPKAEFEELSSSSACIFGGFSAANQKEIFVMTDLILRIFVRDHKNTEDPAVRDKCGRVAGAVGIVTNFLLFLMKIIVGTVFHSVSVTADAVNNLTDSGSSVVTLIGFKMASKPADEKHPFGHARIEYLSGVIVSFIVIFLGLQLGMSSVEKILTPEENALTPVALVVLVISILAKLWQCLFYRKVGRMIKSESVEATSKDSRNDVIATSVVLLGAVITMLTGVNLDGYMGAAVALFIVFSGVQLTISTADPLLGQAPEGELVQTITEKMLSYPGIIGMHDLAVHNYGVGRCFASAHCEVDAKNDILVSHDLIDNIERDFSRDLGIHMVIHLDPVIVGDARTDALHCKVQSLVTALYPTVTIHDFRVIWGVTHSNIVFDAAVPFSVKDSDAVITQKLEAEIQKLDPDYRTVVTIDRR